MRREKTKDEIRQMRETAERIKSMREGLGMTQDEMAEKAGLTLDNYKKIEDASNAMSMVSLRGVQKALDVPFDYLLQGQAAPVDELWQKINACSKKECLELLIKLVQKFAGEDFSQDEVMDTLVADVHKNSYGKELRRNQGDI